MARQARYKSDSDAFYHLTNRVAGGANFFPFRNKVARRKLLSMARFYMEIYCCRVAGYAIMSNHYHFVVHFEELRKLDRSELERRARKLYGRRKARLITRSWSDEKWDAFNDRLFDVSKLMSDFGCNYAKWYNRKHGRRGHFWGERYKNIELLDAQAVQDAIIYVELNPVRAGLVRRPEDWKYSSAWLRKRGRDQFLIPLSDLFPPARAGDTLSAYRALLYYRGAVPSKENQAVIPEWIIRQEARRGFTTPGAFLRRLRFFTDGIAVGAPDQVLGMLSGFLKQRRYTRRRHPIFQPHGQTFSLREQRGHAATR